MPRMMWALSALSMALLWHAASGLVLCSADVSQIPSIRSPFSRPVDMQALASFHAKYSDGTGWDQEIKVRFQWDGETAYATESAKRPGAPEDEQRSMRFDCLYRDGELVRFSSDMLGATTENFMAVFVSSKFSANHQPGTPGDIFNMHPGFAVAGYFDGYRFDDYFSNGAEVRTEQDGHLIHVTGQSRYGRAEAWLDPAHGDLPERVAIDKGPDHYTTFGRTNGSVRFDRNDPRSDLVALRLEIKDVQFDEDQDGRPYIQECTQVLVKTSQRGVEAEETVRWTVNSIAFDPAFDSGRIDPDVAIKDGQPVSAEGAPQLPFRWSRKARWVIPDANDLADDSATKGSSGSLGLLMGVNLGAVIGALAWWLYRRRRK